MRTCALSDQRSIMSFPLIPRAEHATIGAVSGDRSTEPATRLNLVSEHYGGVAKQKVSTAYSQPRAS